MRKLYAELAGLVDARRRCIFDLDPKDGFKDETILANRREWRDKHEETIEYLVKRFMPSGSGFDSGTKIDLDRSTKDKLVFTTSYHHMSEHGYYDGWTEHSVIVTPSLAFGFIMRITGRNRNDIKDYMYESFYTALNEDCEFALYQRAYSIQVETLNHLWACSVEHIAGGRHTCCDPDRYKAESKLVEYIENNRDLVVALP